MLPPRCFNAKLHTMKTTTAAKLVIFALIALFGIIAMTGCEKPEQPQPTQNGIVHWVITAETDTQVDYSFQFTDNKGTRIVNASSREPYVLDLISGGSYRIEWRTTTPHVNAYILWQTSPSQAGWSRSTKVAATKF